MGAVISMVLDWSWQSWKYWYGYPELSKKFELPGQVKYEDILLCAAHSLKDVQKVINLQLEEGDVVVASYPKAGTTFLQEIVWLVRNKADLEGAQKVPNVARVPYIDMGFLDTLPIWEALPRPRSMKTHVPWRMLPQGVKQGKNKVVTPFRNPKDTLVSYYHFHRMNGVLGHFTGTWNDFFEYFRDNDYKLLYGNPFDHYLSYWQHRNDDNVLIVFYEDMVLDRVNQIRKIAEFLEVNLTDEQVADIAKATGFDVMKASVMTNMDIAKLEPESDCPLRHDISPFMRAGKIGDWKNYFNDEQNAIIDAMCRERLRDTGLSFRYE